MVVWGAGSALREFLHVDDMAVASVFVMNLGKVAFNNEVKPMQSQLNVGSGLDCSIKKFGRGYCKGCRFSRLHYMG